MAEIYQYYNSTIPWDLKFPSDFEMEDTKFFDGGNFKNDEEKQRQLGCFRFFNEAFPFFIPMEHHEMSVERIMKRSPKGQYWGVAIHFLISIKGHGAAIWDEFQRQLRHEEISCHPYISNSTRLKLLPNGAPLCNSSEDYFLEPILLTQLIREPNLFHQLLVAALSVTLDFERELTEFYCRPFPKEFSKEVNILQDTLLSMQEFILKGFSLTQNICDGILDQSPMEGVILSFESALCFLIFWCNPMRAYLIESLKVHCYDTPRVGERTLLIRKNEDFVSKLGIYDPRSWMGAVSYKDRNMFYQSTTNLDHKDEPAMIVATEEDNGILVSIFQKIIWLQAEFETRIEFPDSTNNESRETDSTLKILEPMKFEEISRELKQQLETDRERWSLHNVYFTYKRKVEEAQVTKLPSASEDPLVIANHFETRIKKLVLSNTTSQYPVHSFAQFMLPCFVASFLEMTTGEESHACTAETKKWLLKFLNKLVSLYEAITKHPNPREEWSKMTNTNIALQIKYRLSSHTLLLSYLRRVSGLLISVLTRGIAPKEYFRFDLFPAFYEALDYGNTQWFPENTPNEEISNRVNDNYAVQLYDFFRKLEISLEHAFGSKQPTLASLWAPDMADLIRTLCLVGLPKQPQRLHYIALKSYSKLLYDILKTLTSIDEGAAKKEISGLTEDRKLSLAFYLTMKHISRDVMMDTLDLNESDLSKIDPTSSDSAIAFHCYLMGEEMWPLRKFYSMRLGFENAVSLDYAKKSAPICYSVAMREIDCGSNKLKMEFPDENWFYPIKHCRFCGCLENPSKFKICTQCEKNQEYPDKNYFCSKKCEKNAMLAYHRMEHSQYARL